MQRATTTAAQRTARSGFTLLELLIVIAVIALLMALLTSAIQGARLRARIAQVGSEISQLDSAIAKFNSTYNVDPPSSLVIPPVGDPWAAIDRSKVRAIWPQFDFATNGGLNNPTELRLSGAECLVFFLGGLQDSSGAVVTTIGFSKSPTTPWSPAGANREGPYFEFDSGRLVDVDSDNAREFIDPLPGQTAPYLYYSSQGKSYTVTNTAAADAFDVFTDTALNPLKIYLKTEKVAATPSTRNTPHRAESFQIVSPGLDGVCGPGGVYTDGSELIDKDLDNNSVLDPFELRAVEADNITNFSAGPLKP